MLDNPYPYLVKKLVSRTKRVGDCFIWQGGKSHGYGVIAYPNRSILVGVHRLAARLFRNAPDDPDVKTLHKNICSSKACWNPEHTYEGSQKDNIRDAIDSGRHVTVTNPWGHKRKV